MTTITQENTPEHLAQVRCPADNDADPDVVRGDYYEELGRLGGIVVQGRGELDQERADAVVNDLRRRGCTVLRDPARRRGGRVPAFCTRRARRACLTVQWSRAAGQDGHIAKDGERPGTFVS